MEQDLAKEICERFSIKPINIKNYSPLTLAYIGDGIFDLIIRTTVVCRGNAHVSALHDTTSFIVMASTQAKILKSLWKELSEEERMIYRRGRNAKPHTIAKNASMHDYRMATGFETLLGYLYLTGQMERVLFLVKTGYENVLTAEENGE